MFRFSALVAKELGIPAIDVADGSIDRNDALRVGVFATGLLHRLDYIEAKRPPASGNKQRSASKGFEAAKSQLLDDDIEQLKRLSANLVECFGDDNPANSRAKLREFIVGLQRRARAATTAEEAPAAASTANERKAS